MRLWLSYFPPAWDRQPPATEGWAPAEHRPIEEIVPAREDVPFDMQELIDAIVDDGTFFPYKDLFAQELITGLARLGGQSVGIIANQTMHRAGVLFSDSSDKAAHFIWICNAFNVPLLFLTDISGYMIGTAVERGASSATAPRCSTPCASRRCRASTSSCARPTAAATWRCPGARPIPTP